MATAHIDVPKVYTALANVLKSLSVAKGGVLPGNMGGKPYITAVDASAEVKRQFVENNLIFLPREEVVKHENIINNNRLQVSIVIAGTYTIISTEDGSSVEVSGTGDGLATGTAVASNIGSTNALKNALLRTFLITEQSVEESAKNGVPDEAPSTTQRKVDAARKPAPAKKADQSSLKDRIRTEFIENDSHPADRDTVNALVKKHKDAGLTGDDVFKAVLTSLEAGEVA